MSKPFFLCAAMLGALLAGCGGGGGSSHAPAPAPSPSASAAATSKAALSITWMGAEHSKSAASAASSVRHALDALASAEPVAMGAVEASCGSCSTVGPNGNVGTIADSATVMVQEVDAAGSPVPVGSPQVTTPSIVTPGSQSTGAADTVQVPVSAASTTTGSGTITVTADGLTSSIPVQVLPNLAIGAETNTAVDVDAVVGVQFGTSGTPTAVTDTSTADVYATLSNGSTPSEFVFPYGFENVTLSGVGISEETGPPVGFTPQGTTLTFNDLVNNLGTESFIVFETAGGHFVYWSLTAGSGLGGAPNYPSGIAEYGSYKFF